MTDEIQRLKGQRDGIQNRLKDEDVRFRKWKRDWQTKWSEMQQKHNQLMAKNNRQEKVIKKLKNQNSKEKHQD